MIPSVIASYVAAKNSRKNNSGSGMKQRIPIFETIEEARKSIIEKYGQQEYMITENAMSINYFDVICIKDNKIWQLTYKKKIKNY